MDTILGVRFGVPMPVVEAKVLGYCWLAHGISAREGESGGSKSAGSTKVLT